ncbi:heme exporter protein CcmD [Notoacmeibacter sp. MSK16QG-6]|uniref:heme exporter protein CcmD n=1 Tax=Notoacmeibacter sp. MSK16QG-6 TaxID=2957982 RepID=UPI00209DDBA7|nr:heme exporter protein CcmD [Notoacmeibacter sp. MSK16QG-6]MCP1199172.1 heme exporter protein CcmD [Notoacmeibacter sp. MSK16QG-6]
MSHFFYIAAAYIVSAITLGGLAAWLVGDMRARRRELAHLHETGHRRRSDRQETLREIE